MKNKTNLYLAFVLCLVVGCQSASFKGSANKDYNSDPPTIVGECTNTTSLVGANVVFAIDNSNSNSYTDCKDPVRVNTSNTTNRCNGQSERERATLLGFDILKTVSQIDSSDSSKQSKVGVVVFPKRSYSSYRWYDLEDSSRTSIGNLLNNTLRTPYGMTPYREGINGARNLFGSSLSNSSNKQNVVIFVTDGEPTDSKVSQLKSEISDLKSQNVKIYTILIADPQDRSSDVESVLKNHRYPTSTIDQLLGRNGNSRIIDIMSEQVITINSSSQLENALTEVIKKTISCN